MLASVGLCMHAYHVGCASFTRCPAGYHTRHPPPPLPARRPQPPLSPTSAGGWRNGGAAAKKADITPGINRRLSPAGCLTPGLGLFKLSPPSPSPLLKGARRGAATAAGSEGFSKETVRCLLSLSLSLFSFLLFQYLEVEFLRGKSSAWLIYPDLYPFLFMSRSCPHLWTP